MEKYKMKGYVARDRRYGETGTGLYLYFTKPRWDEDLGMWFSFSDNSQELPLEWFPDLKYTDEPIEVELIIKR